MYMCSKIYEKILGDFSWGLEVARKFYDEINENLIFDLRIFTLRTVFIQRITFVNRGMGVFEFIDVTKLWALLGTEITGLFRHIECREKSGI
jgi:hypothetical protein